MEIARYSGLFDELEKISEVRRKDVTKETFKRHLKTLAPVFLGAAGYVGGLRRKAIRDYIEKGDDGPK